MKISVTLSLIILTTLLLISCINKSKYAERILTKAEVIVEQYPDSALHLIDSIQNPYELNKRQFNEYILRSVQAKDKANQNIASDTLIFQARDYFKKENDEKKQALAEFYCGRVLQSQKQIEKAMTAYLNAEKIADKVNDIYLSGMADFYIGMLNYEHNLIKEEAILKFKEANVKFSSLKDKYKHQIVTNNCIANSFLVKHSVDSAIVYYQKGIKIAEDNNDIEQLTILNQNIGLAYLQVGNLKSSKAAIQRAVSYSSKCEKPQQAKIYFALAKVYQHENKLDSAAYYANLSLSLAEGNDALKATIYKFLSVMESSSGNIQKSFDYYRLYAERMFSILETNDNSKLLEVQKKYNYESMQNANKKLTIERLWLLIAFILIMIIILSLFYKKHVKNKEAMYLAKQQIYQLKQMTAKQNEQINDNADKNNTNKKLREMLFKQLDILKQITLLEVQLNENEKTNGRWLLDKVNNIICKSNEEFDWSNFYQTVNALYDDFLARLSDLYPALTKEEILVCCLSKIELNTDEIGLIMRLSTNAVQKRKSSIREKTGMKKQDNFARQLELIVKKSVLPLNDKT